jgi:putative phosphoribosyl transferase
MMHLNNTQTNCNRAILNNTARSGHVFFQNREQGAKLLADQLVWLNEGKLGETSHSPLVILSIPNGGVITGQAVASVLGARLDILISEKIVSPCNFNITIGAVVHDGTFYSLPIYPQGEKEEDSLIILRPQYFDEQVSHTVKRIQPRLERFRGNSTYDLKNKTVVLVDDGMATGATMCAAAQWARIQKPKQLIVAVPVASKESINMLERIGDKVIVIHRSSYCQSIEEHYRDFTKVSDDEVESIVNKSSSHNRSIPISHF